MWTDELTGAVEQNNFLLDKGRLKLKTVKQTFRASLVRMSIGKTVNLCNWSVKFWMYSSNRKPENHGLPVVVYSPQIKEDANSQLTV